MFLNTLTQSDNIMMNNARRIKETYIVMSFTVKSNIYLVMIEGKSYDVMKVVFFVFELGLLVDFIQLMFYCNLQPVLGDKSND